MKTHEQVDMYNAIWLSVPAYHNLTPKDMSYEDLSQWNAKEMKEMSRFPFVVVTHLSTTQMPRTASQIQSCNCVHTGIVKILSVCMILISQWCNIELNGGRCPSVPHLQRCFLPRPSRQKVECSTQCPETGPREPAKGRQANNPWNLDAIQQAAHNECLAGLYQPQDRWFQGVRCRFQLSEDALDVSLVRTDSSIQSLATVFWWETWITTQNAPQGRLELLQSHSQLPATSTHRSASYSRFQIRELNLQALAQRREDSAAAYTILPAGDDLAAPLSSLSYPKPEFMGPQQHHHDGKHPDGIIKDFRALLDHMHDAMHRVALYSSTQEFIKH